jgi:hypothetical protein
VHALFGFDIASCGFVTRCALLASSHLTSKASRTISYDQLLVRLEKKLKTFSHAMEIFCLCSSNERKKIVLTSLNIFSSSLVCLVSLLMQITTKKQSLEIKNRPHTTKGAHSQPLRGGFLHRRQSLFAYFHCSSSQAALTGVRDESEMMSLTAR